MRKCSVFWSLAWLNPTCLLCTIPRSFCRGAAVPAQYTGACFCQQLAEMSLVSLCLRMQKPPWFTGEGILYSETASSDPVLEQLSWAKWSLRHLPLLRVLLDFVPEEHSATWGCQHNGTLELIDWYCDVLTSKVCAIEPKLNNVWVLK